MPLPVVASSSSVADTTIQTTRNCPVPSGTVSGDGLLLFVGIDGTATITDPTGWTLLDASATFDSSPSNCKLYERIADGTEGANIAIASTSEIASAICIRFTGITAGSFVELVSVFAGSPDSRLTEIITPCPIVHPFTDDTLIIRLLMVDDGATTVTQPSGHTNIVTDVGANTSGVRVSACHTSQASAARVPAAGFTTNDGSENTVGYTVVVRSTTTPATVPPQPVIRNCYMYSGDASTLRVMTYNKPFGTVDNDILLLAQVADLALVLITPTGFTNIRTGNSSSVVYVQADFRIASSEGASYVGSNAINRPNLGILMRITNAHITAPVDVSSAFNSGTTTPMEATTITPSVNNCLVVFVGGADDDAIAFGAAVPSSYNSVIGYSSQEGIDICFSIATINQTTAAATGTVSATLSSNEFWGAFVIAIKPIVAGGYTIGMDRANYVLTGRNVSTRAARRVTMDRGLYVLTGQELLLRRGRIITMDRALYALTGRDVITRATRRVTMDRALFALTGRDVITRASRRVTMDQGVYTLTGRDVNFRAARRVVMDQGVYTFSGRDVNIRASRRVTMDRGLYSFNGRDVNFRAARRIVMDQGVYIFSGQAVGLTKAGSFRLAFNTGFYTVTGHDVTLTYTPSAISANIVLYRRGKARSAIRVS